MAETSGDEARLSAALDRIERAIAAVAATGPEVTAQAASGDDAARAALTAELAEARASLEAERAANAQLVERVRGLKQKQETVVAGLERRVAQLRADLEQSGAELQRHRRLVEDLTEANAALRAAAERGLADPALLDRSMAAELSAMGAQRAAEKAEVETVLSEIRRLIGEGADA